MRDPVKSPDGRDRFPGYDVLAKRLGPSWNEQTRRVVTQRLSISAEPRFFDVEEFKTVTAIAARIVPQPVDRAPVPVAALVDDRLFRGMSDGYRLAGMPRDGEAWRLGLKALDAESVLAYGGRFYALAEGLQDALLTRMQSGELKAPQWEGRRAQDFFDQRMARDIVLAYYSHPAAWS